MPGSAQAEPEHAPPSAAEPEPVVSPAPVHVSPSAAVSAEPVVSSAPVHASSSAAVTDEPASSSPHELEQGALARELHNIYMASWPVCVEMAQALRGISDLSCFKGLSFQDLKQTLLTYYDFSNIQIRRVDAYLNPAPEVTVVSSSSTSNSVFDVPSSDDVRSSDDSDDIPLVSVSVRRATKASSKRSRLSSTSAPILPIALSSANFSCPDDVKRALKIGNPSCHPGIRSSAGKYIRFHCKHRTSAVLPCHLNISGSQVDGVVTLSPATYIPGICCCRICTSCDEDLVFFASCENGHRLCLECFDHLVRSQVRTNKANFIAANCVVFCQYCDPVSELDIQTHSNSLTKETWQYYLDACSERAVICEQQIWQAREATTTTQTKATTDDLAFVGDLICRMCPTCKRYMSDDFDGCVALKCGRTVGSGAGCGADICAYCSGVFSCELDVHQHQKTCMFNPNPGDIHPDEDYFKKTIWDIRRERVWLHVMENLPNRIPSIWINIANEHPELKLTPAWLEERSKCVTIAEEFAIGLAEFAKLIPQYLKCIKSLKDVFGTDEGDEQRLWRACIINKGNIETAVSTLIDNPSAD